MCRTESDIVDDLLEEELVDLYHNTARPLDTLQAIVETGGRKRPPEPTLEMIRELCDMLLRKVDAVHKKTLGVEERWEK